MTSSVGTRINMRVSAEDDALIRQAADASGSSVTEFVLSSARLAAERKLAEQRLWRLDAGAWDQFVSALEAQPTDSHLAKISELFTRAAIVEASTFE